MYLLQNVPNQARTVVAQSATSVIANRGSRTWGCNSCCLSAIWLSTVKLANTTLAGYQSLLKTLQIFVKTADQCLSGGSWHKIPRTGCFWDMLQTSSSPSVIYGSAFKVRNDEAARRLIPTFDNLEDLQSIIVRDHHSSALGILYSCINAVNALTFLRPSYIMN